MKRFASVYLSIACACLLFSGTVWAFVYVVHEGDTLSEIVHHFLGKPIYGKNGGIARTIALNPRIRNPDLIYPGQHIVLNAEASRSLGSVEMREPPLAQSVAEVKKEAPAVTLEPPGFTASLGFTRVDYLETGAAEYQAVMITPKINYKKPLSTRWDLGANAFFTAAPITKNQNVVTLRFFGANVRAGYQIESVPRPWRLSLMGGLYYTTTFETNNSVGFKDMAGPQIFPVLSREFRRGESGFAYLKYAPMLDGAAVTFRGREYAAGLGYSIQSERIKRPVSVTLDYSQLRLNFENLLLIRSQTLTLGVGTTW